MHNRSSRGYSTSEQYHRTARPHPMNTLSLGPHNGLMRGGLCL